MYSLSIGHNMHIYKLSVLLFKIIMYTPRHMNISNL